MVVENLGEKRSNPIYFLALRRERGKKIAPELSSFEQSVFVP